MDWANAGQTRTMHRLLAFENELSSPGPAFEMSHTVGESANEEARS